MAPINGPNTGIILVMPMIRLINSGYGIFKISRTMQQIMPMMTESISLPDNEISKSFVYKRHLVHDFV